jgi:glycine/D-amino acid oxidase-like deaminating enzyme
METVEAVVIGAGVVGLACARALAGPLAGDVLVLGTSHANPQGPRSPSLQAWSYAELLAGLSAVVERRSGESAA